MLRGGMLQRTASHRRPSVGGRWEEGLFCGEKKKTPNYASLLLLLEERQNRGVSGKPRGW